MSISGWAQRRPHPAQNTWAADFAPVDEKIQQWIAKGYYPGASLLVAKDDQIIYQHYYGSYTPETQVYIASAGKWLAAATIAALVDEGKLRWDDPVVQYLPDWTDAKGQATLRQLLSHTSGYPDYQPKGNPRDDYQTLAESVKNIKPLPLEAAPGTRFQYGGLAMQVAGRMAELATGKDWEALFQEKIARPLGMQHTHFTPVDLGGGHSPMLGGGARSTLADYEHFLNMLSHAGTYRGMRVLSVKALAEMQADQVGKAEVKAKEFVEEVRGNTHRSLYGLGEWREELDAQGRAMLLSSPSWAGAYPWIDKTTGVYGFFLTHVDPSKTGATGFNSFLSSPALARFVREIVSNHIPPNPRGLPVKKGVADIGDAQLYYEEAGQGPALVLLHGHSFDRREWDPQFQALAKKFRVVRYDLRSYGLSSLPQEGREFLHAEDLHRLLKVLGIPQAHLVGLSLGGYVVTDFIALHPEEALSAVAASGDVYEKPGPEEPVTESEVRRRRSEIERLRQRGIIAFKEDWLVGLIKSSGPAKDNSEPLMRTMVGEWSAWQPLHVEPRLLLGTSVLTRLAARAVRVPYLLLTPEYRSDAGRENRAKLLTLIPGSRNLIIAKAGHVSNLDNPEGFTKAVLDFIAGVPGAPPADKRRR
ncbi:class A beta-lactamase-related serine hydrolase [Hymenobacter jejuensis]|uniref:class A beta-lactamase-related serine hydrolase n=1 Tax=Hymenobacter jejuensis TaxID=2502781 RepID=UPI001E29A8DB|nr:class A beta-lactamase-related serine hydrolase [Hymenobacter jejuensis]